MLQDAVVRALRLGQFLLASALFTSGVAMEAQAYREVLYPLFDATVHLRPGQQDNFAHQMKFYANLHGSNIFIHKSKMNFRYLSVEGITFQMRGEDVVVAGFTYPEPGGLVVKFSYKRDYAPWNLRGFFLTQRSLNLVSARRKRELITDILLLSRFAGAVQIIEPEPLKLNTCSLDLADPERQKAVDHASIRQMLLRNWTFLPTPRGGFLACAA